MLETIKATWEAFIQDKVPRLAASIAYATVFALTPLLVILIAIVGFALGVEHGGHDGQSTAQVALLDQIRSLAGPQSADIARGMLIAAFDKPRQSILTQIAGWIAFIFGASGLFVALQDALNTIWNIERTKGGITRLLRGRVAAFAMILFAALLFLVSFAANAALTFVSTHFIEKVASEGSPYALQAGTIGLNIVVVTAMFAVLFKILPDVALSWRDVLAGAFTTGVLFVVGEILISLYLAYAGVASAYGAAGSILVALLWIYYSAIIFLVGAEYTKVRSKRPRTELPTILRVNVEAPPGVDPREAPAVVVRP